MIVVRFLRRLPWIVVYLGYFLYELVVANIRVARDVLTPGLQITPGIVRVTTRCQTRWEVAMLANSLTMTPGTLSLEVDTATNDLFVHGLYVTTREDFQRDVSRMENLLLKAMR
jgi:multicomponent Na+:H+ antiporter subunit E